MKPLLAAVGAALLALGFALIAISPMIVSSSLYRAEATSLSNGASAANLTSIYKTVSSAVDQSTWIAIAGAVLAPIGGALLAYAFASKGPEKPPESSPAPVAAPSS